MLISLCFCLFVGQGLYLVNWHTLVGDEVIHVVAGVLFWRTGVFEGGFDNPPLLQYLHGLPYELQLSSYELVSTQRPIAARLIYYFL